MGPSSNKTIKSGRLTSSTGQKKKFAGGKPVKSIKKKSVAVRKPTKKNQEKKVEGKKEVKRINKKKGDVSAATKTEDSIEEEPDELNEIPLMPGKAILQSVDGKEFIVDFKVANMIGPFERYHEEFPEEQMAEGVRFPLPKVEGNELKKVIEWCEAHRDDPVYTDQERVEARLTRDLTIPESDKKWLTLTESEVSQKNFFALSNAANFCEIPRLYLNFNKVLAGKLTELKTTEKMREFFKIENDWAPGEEEKIIEQQKWCE